MSILECLLLARTDNKVHHQVTVKLVLFGNLLLALASLAVAAKSEMAEISTAKSPAGGGSTQTLYRAVLLDECEVWIEGDSTIGGFSSYASVIDLKSSISLKKDAPQSEGSAAAVGAKVFDVSQAVVTVPIEKMKSRYIGLAGRLHKALKYKEFPNIVFSMESYSLHALTNEVDHAGDLQNDDRFGVTANGLLSLAGVTNSATLEAEGTLTTNDVLHVTGSENVLMSDFGVPRPSVFFGKIVVKDKIEVHWDLELTLEPMAASDADDEEQSGK